LHSWIDSWLRINHITELLPVAIVSYTPSIDFFAFLAVDERESCTTTTPTHGLPLSPANLV
jgi:hypothetical protein